MRGDRQIDFATEVLFHLDRFSEESRLPTQDELDVFLLGGTVPAVPIPQPDPECRNCWGFGKVCPCHGVCGAHGGSYLNAHLSRANTSQCECIKKQIRRR